MKRDVTSCSTHKICHRFLIRACFASCILQDSNKSRIEVGKMCYTRMDIRNSVDVSVWKCIGKRQFRGTTADETTVLQSTLKKWCVRCIGFIWHSDRLLWTWQWTLDIRKPRERYQLSRKIYFHMLSRRLAWLISIPLCVIHPVATFENNCRSKVNPYLYADCN